MKKKRKSQSVPECLWSLLEWTPLVIKTRQLLSERESQSAMIICRICARMFFQFPVMFTNNMKWRSTSWLTMFNSLFSFPTFLLFSPLRLVKSNMWVQWNWHLTPERSIDLPKFLLLSVPNVTTRSLYLECIANLKLPIDAFYRESRSGVNIAKRYITTGLFGLSINWQLLLSVKWRHMFSYEVKTGPIYGMETNIKSGNGWF